MNLSLFSIGSKRFIFFSLIQWYSFSNLFYPFIFIPYLSTDSMYLSLSRRFKGSGFLRLSTQLIGLIFYFSFFMVKLVSYSIFFRWFCRVLPLLHEFNLELLMLERSLSVEQLKIYHAFLYFSCFL